MNEFYYALGGGLAGFILGWTLKWWRDDVWYKHQLQRQNMQREVFATILKLVQEVGTRNSKKKRSHH